MVKVMKQLVEHSPTYALVVGPSPKFTLKYTLQDLQVQGREDTELQKAQCSILLHRKLPLWFMGK